MHIRSNTIRSQGRYKITPILYHNNILMPHRLLGFRNQWIETKLTKLSECLIISPGYRLSFAVHVI